MDKTLRNIIIAILVIGAVAYFAAPAEDSTRSNSSTGTYRVYNQTYIIKSDGTAIVTKGENTYNTYWEYLGESGDIRVRKDRENSWTLGWDYIDFSDRKIYWDYGDYRSHSNGVTYTKTN